MAGQTLPPVAPAKPHVVLMPNGTARNDPYYWLRDDEVKEPEVLEYLNAENDYAKNLIKQNRKLENRLLDDMDRRVPRLETSTPTPSESMSYWYGRTRGPGQDYWVYDRRPASAAATPSGAGASEGSGAGGRGPLSYGPDLKAAAEVVLDVNRLAKGFQYCDVAAVKPSPDGRYVAFTVDTVGDEMYELVVQEIATGRRVPTEGSVSNRRTAPLGGIPNCGPSVEWSADSSSVFVLLLTAQTHEAFKLVRVRLLPGTAGGRTPQPELLLEDEKAGSVLEMAGPTACGRFLIVSRRSEGYTALLALPMKRAPGSRPSRDLAPPKGVPKGVKLYGKAPWVLVAPESAAVDVLRAEHLYGDGRTEMFAVLADSDKYPDGHVAIVTDGDLKGRRVVIPGQRGRQIVDIAVIGSCTKGGDGGNSTTGSGGGLYLVVHILENMIASIEVYDATALRQGLESDRMVPGRRRRRAAAVAATANVGDRGVSESDDVETIATSDDGDDDHDGGGDYDEAEVYQDDGGDNPKGAGADGEHKDSKEERQESQNRMEEEEEEEEADGDGSLRIVRGRGECPGGSAAAGTATSECSLQTGSEEKPARRALADTALPLTLLWTYSPGAAISSLHIEHRCWPGNLPYVRLSYSCMTTPLTTVDLDLSAKKAYERSVEKVEDFSPDRYRSVTLWATTPDGTRVPASVAGRADAWPAAPGGRPLPCILQLYGAYGRKLLPDFIPADLALMDGAGTAAGGPPGSGPGPGPSLMVLAHVRGGGELGSAWHVEGKRLQKWNTADDFAAVVQMLMDSGYCDPRALAVWGRSAGGLAAGMALHRCPPRTFRAAILDVPFVDVVGAMTDPSLPLTVKERPEWGDPLKYQEDYDYILSYSPYDNVEPVARQTPALMVTCSINDPRVPYWGPAKYVARLRAAMTAARAATAASAPATAGAGDGVGAGGGGPVLLLTEMGAGGHFSASGASGRLAERAMRGAFLLSKFREAIGVPMSGAKPAGAGRTS